MTITTAVRLLHVLSATVLFGTGIGAAFVLWRTAHRGATRDLRTVTGLVLEIDRVFIAPASVVQLLTGVWLVEARGYSFLDPWILAALALFAVAGVAWIVGVRFEHRIRILACDAEGQAIPHREDRLRHLLRWWTGLGLIAFGSVALIFGLMVFRPSW